MLDQRLSAARELLAAVSDTPALDAQVLLAHITGQPRARLLAHPETSLTPQQEHALEAALVRLTAGEPLPYVIGHWEFFGLSFSLTPAALIPRPETELLVETALAWLRDRPERRRAADVGTGSGCIAVALAVNTQAVHITATDRSAEALEVARQNARQHGVAERIAFHQTDLLETPGPFFDLICANPPYIPTAELHSLKVYDREPTLALDGGVDGLAVIQPLLAQAAVKLAPAGLLLVEIGATQGPDTTALARRAFPQSGTAILKDLTGHDRLLVVQSK